MVFHHEDSPGIGNTSSESPTNRHGLFWIKATHSIKGQQDKMAASSLLLPSSVTSLSSAMSSGGEGGRGGGVEGDEYDGDECYEDFEDIKIENGSHIGVGTCNLDGGGDVNDEAGVDDKTDDDSVSTDGDDDDAVNGDDDDDDTVDDDDVDVDGLAIYDDDDVDGLAIDDDDDVDIDDVDEHVENGELTELDSDYVIPDGGWGWVVCFGSFMINFILDGTMFSFGILLLDLGDLGSDKGTTSWAGGALIGFSMFTGPLVSYLLESYSIRQVTITGACIALVGFVMSAFSTDVNMFIVSYGVIGGTGFSLMYLPAIIVVGLYFNKKRAIATGIATSGSGLGTFAYAYIANTLLASYKWRGAILIMAGFVFNCAICGMLFRPIVPTNVTSINIEKPKQTTEDDQKKEEPNDDSSASSGYSSDQQTVHSLRQQENKISHPPLVVVVSSGCSAGGDVSKNTFHSGAGDKTNSCVSLGNDIQSASKSRWPRSHSNSVSSMTSSCDHRLPSDVTSGSFLKDAIFNHHAEVHGRDHKISVSESPTRLSSLLQSNHMNTTTAAINTSNNNKNNKDDTADTCPLVTTDHMDENDHSPERLPIPLFEDAIGNGSNIVSVIDMDNGELIYHQLLDQTNTSSTNNSNSTINNNNHNNNNNNHNNNNNNHNNDRTKTKKNTKKRTPTSHFENEIKSRNLECFTSASIAANSFVTKKSSPFLSPSTNGQCTTTTNKANHNNKTNHNTNKTNHNTNKTNHNTNKTNHNTNKTNHNTNKTNHNTNKTNHNTNKTNHNTNKTNHNTNKTNHNTNKTNHNTNQNDHQYSFPAGRLYQSAGYLHDRTTGLNSNTQELYPFANTRLLKSEYKLNDYHKIHHYNHQHHHHHHHHRQHHTSSGHNLKHQNRSMSKSSNFQHQLSKGLLRPIFRQDIYYGGSVNHLSASKQFGSMASFMAAMTRASSSSTDTSDVEHERAESRLMKKSGLLACCHGNKRLSSLSLFKDKTFVLLLITFVMWTAQSVSLTYLPDLAVSRGVSRSDAAFLISIVGIANVLGRFLAGVVTDCLRLPAIWLYIAALNTAALVNITLAFGDSYVLLSACAAVFGLCMGVAVSMRTIVLAEELGIEALTQSFGLVAMFQGVAFTINAPIAGGLISKFDSYIPPFVMVTTMYAISGICVILVVIFRLCGNRDKCQDVWIDSTPSLQDSLNDLELGNDYDDGDLNQDDRSTFIHPTSITADSTTGSLYLNLNK